MKICPTCNKSCYDTELFCPDCGCAMPGVLRCNYCGTTINDVTATNCPNCRGVLTIDRYPEYKGIIHCSACGKPRPVTSKYCTACGIATVAAPRPVVNNGQGKIVIHSTKAAVLGVIIFIVLLCSVPLFLFSMGIFVDIINGSYDYEDKDGYTYSYNSDGTITENNDKGITILTDVDFRRVNINDLAKEIETIAVGDYLELTGIIDARGSAYCELVPSEFNRENKDTRTDIYWEYESESGNYIADYCRVGDEITIRCRVEYVYPSINTLTCNGICIVGADVKPN